MWVKPVRIRADRADGLGVSIDLWHRATTAVRERYRASAPALYGAGLHTDEDEGAARLPAVPEIGVPAPRRAPTSSDTARVPHQVAAASR